MLFVMWNWFCHFYILFNMFCLFKDDFLSDVVDYCWKKRRIKLSPCKCVTHLSAYTSLVRSTLEYGAVIWDPFTQNEINEIERLQRQAASFITNDYHSWQTGSMTQTFKKCHPSTLQQRRKDIRLTFLFKIVEDMITAIPKDNYLVQLLNKRKIKPKQFQDYVSKKHCW